MNLARRKLLAAAPAAAAASIAQQATVRPARTLLAAFAPTPPMGRNSWSSFATTINESEARETVRIMAEQRRP